MFLCSVFCVLCSVFCVLCSVFVFMFCVLSSAFCVLRSVVVFCILCFVTCWRSEALSPGPIIPPPAVCLRDMSVEGDFSGFGLVGPQDLPTSGSQSGFSLS